LSHNILIVEDEANLGTTLHEFLSRKKYDCKLATNAKDAKEIFQNNLIKVVLMDIGLPDGNGLELAEDFIKEKPELIVLFLSAMNDPETRLEGLSLGAYDYITKPFDLRELILRLERILKTQESSELEYSFGSLHYYPSRMCLIDESKTKHQLSFKESEIFKMLISNIEVVVSRDEMIEKIWGANEYPSNRTIDNYIVKLRKIAESHQGHKLEIISVRGVGYKATKKDN
jgi:two-component system alkaline phosphatase synthesis response regulator PhoP